MLDQREQRKSAAVPPAISWIEPNAARLVIVPARTDTSDGSCRAVVVTLASRQRSDPTARLPAAPGPELEGKIRRADHLTEPDAPVVVPPASRARGRACGTPRFADCAIAHFCTSKWRSSQRLRKFPRAVRVSRPARPLIQVRSPGIDLRGLTAPNIANRDGDVA